MLTTFPTALLASLLYMSILSPPSVYADCPVKTWVQFSDFCFYASDEAQNYTESRKACEGMAEDASLASFSTQEEMEDVFKRMLASKENDFWIGLWHESSPDQGVNITVKKRGWKWTSSGKSILFDAWGDDEPTGNSQCARMDQDGKWKDRRCDHKYRYLCRVQANEESGSNSKSSSSKEKNGNSETEIPSTQLPLSTTSTPSTVPPTKNVTGAIRPTWSPPGPSSSPPLTPEPQGAPNDDTDMAAMFGGMAVGIVLIIIIVINIVVIMVLRRRWGRRAAAKKSVEEGNIKHTYDNNLRQPQMVADKGMEEAGYSGQYARIESIREQAGMQGRAAVNTDAKYATPIDTVDSKPLKPWQRLSQLYSKPKKNKGKRTDCAVNVFPPSDVILQEGADPGPHGSSQENEENIYDDGESSAISWSAPSLPPVQAPDEGGSPDDNYGRSVLTLVDNDAYNRN